MFMSEATMLTEPEARTAHPAAPHSISAPINPPCRLPWGLLTSGRSSISSAGPISGSSTGCICMSVRMCDAP